MKFSIVIPCYNEAATIGRLIRAVIASPIEPKEIIIVDDCSTDGTREWLKEQPKDLVAKILYHDANLGKGAALRTGLTHVTGDIVIIQDADLEYNPKEYGKLVALIVDGQADVVYGSRLMSTEYRRVMYFWHYVGNSLLTLMSNIFTNLNLTDMETCYKVFRTEVINRITIEENRFGCEPEITAKIARLKPRIYEVGITYSGRTYAEGKKINWKDGFRAIWCILKYNLRPCLLELISFIVNRLGRVTPKR